MDVAHDILQIVFGGIELLCWVSGFQLFITPERDSLTKLLISE